mmetsp:Transcript_138174/g.240384  ORF Transcript_138174/g.240384 Transcript_138174/m.240384 type:complete len:338 (-) Transcript_138174:218-1231(-)
MAVNAGLAALVTQAPDDDTGSPQSSVNHAEPAQATSGAAGWCRCFSSKGREERPQQQKLAAVVPCDTPAAPTREEKETTTATPPPAEPTAPAQPQATVAKVSASEKRQSSSPKGSKAEVGELKAKGCVNEPPQLGPQTGDNIGRKTLVLDLDETLVHSSFRVVQNADITITVEIEGEFHQVYVRKRPGCDEFLIRVAQLYEVVIYTASMSKYANPLLDKLDTFNVCTFRLFREACTRHSSGYVKDLSRLGRDLKHVIIIDNSPTCYLLQPDNAIPIRTWRDDIHDRELLDLIPILYSLADVDDIPKVLLQIIWAAEEEDDDTSHNHKDDKKSRERSK